MRTNGPDELLQRNMSLILCKLKVFKSKGDPRLRLGRVLLVVKSPPSW